MPPNVAPGRVGGTGLAQPRPSKAAARPGLGAGGSGHRTVHLRMQRASPHAPLQRIAGRGCALVHRCARDGRGWMVGSGAARPSCWVGRHLCRWLDGARPAWLTRHAISDRRCRAAVPPAARACARTEVCRAGWACCIPIEGRSGATGSVRRRTRPLARPARGLGAPGWGPGRLVPPVSATGRWPGWRGESVWALALACAKAGCAAALAARLTAQRRAWLWRRRRRLAPRPATQGRGWRAPGRARPAGAMWGPARSLPPLLRPCWPLPPRPPLARGPSGAPAAPRWLRRAAGPRRRSRARSGGLGRPPWRKRWNRCWLQGCVGAAACVFWVQSRRRQVPGRAARAAVRT